jgi:hypothetical protein
MSRQSLITPGMVTTVADRPERRFSRNSLVFDWLLPPAICASLAQTDSGSTHVTHAAVVPRAVIRVTYRDDGLAPSERTVAGTLMGGPRCRRLKQPVSEHSYAVDEDRARGRQYGEVVTRIGVVGDE